MGIYNPSVTGTGPSGPAANAPHNTNILDMTGGTGSIVLDLAGGVLYGNNNNLSIDFLNRQLISSDGFNVLAWDSDVQGGFIQFRAGIDLLGHTLTDTTGQIIIGNTINMEGHTLYGSGGDINNIAGIFDIGFALSVDSNNRLLTNPAGGASNPVIDWGGSGYNNAANLSFINTGSATTYQTMINGSLTILNSVDSGDGLLLYFDSNDLSGHIRTSNDNFPILIEGAPVTIKAIDSGVTTATFGSSAVHINDSSGNLSVLASDRQLYNSSNQAAVNWGNGQLYSSSNLVCEWTSQNLYTNGQQQSLNWDQRVCIDDGGQYSIDWNNAYLSYNGTHVLQWFAQKLVDGNGTDSLHWGYFDRYLLDNAGNRSVAWNDRQLVNSGTILVDWNSLLLADNASTNSIDWGNRVLKDTSGNTAFDWSTAGLIILDADLSMNAHNLISDTTTGVKIGTATSQKLGFFNATPVVQQTGNAVTALSNLGLVTSATFPTSNISGILAVANGGTNINAYTLGDTIYCSASSVLSKLAGNTTAVKQFLSQTGTGSVSAAPAWGALATADLPAGVPIIVGNARGTGKTAAFALTTYTVGASDTTFQISANVNVTAVAVASFQVTCTYTDETNTSRTLVLNFSQISGTLVQTITAALGVGAYEGVPLQIRAKAGTTIIIASAAGGTYTSVTYNIEERIMQL